MRTYQPGPRDQTPAVTWRQWLLPLGAAADIAHELGVTQPDAWRGARPQGQEGHDAGRGAQRQQPLPPRDRGRLAARAGLVRAHCDTPSGPWQAGPGM
jgi:hypothetical protein